MILTSEMIDEGLRLHRERLEKEAYLLADEIWRELVEQMEIKQPTRDNLGRWVAV